MGVAKMGRKRVSWLAFLWWTITATYDVICVGRWSNIAVG